MPIKKVDKKARKGFSLRRIYEMIGKYKQIIAVTLENVGSLQVQQIRKDLYQHKGLLVIGKNTIFRKAVGLRASELPPDSKYDELRPLGKPLPEIGRLSELLRGKVGLIFTDEAIFDLKPRIEANKVAAAAKVGVIAPIDVIIPPGPTGMDPSQISFFHALQISTKINKQQIEIIKDYQVCAKGKLIGSSEVALLSKLNLKPFFYNMKVIAAYNNGAILGEDIISLSTESILKTFQSAVSNVTGLSMESGIPTQLSAPHLISNAFKNIAAIGLNINYQFAQLASAQSAPKKEEKKEEKKEAQKEEKPAEKKEEKPEEGEANVDMGGLFD
eukprot:TRINITY_DN2687_c0_g1_i1.p1 TRINITY_DN2687_c0_g1~~TRINITY_DN2687_c0_g1_i1.p1  ORF type:complete len:329 (+),score=95.42 TRINITY_DN2687_c0_g1_i1:286-1272(+)